MTLGTRAGLVTVGLWTAVFMAWIASGWGGAAATRTFDDVVTTATALAAAGCCGWAAATFPGRRRAAFALIAGGCLSWGLGNAVWSVLELVLHQNPFPSLADAFYLASLPACGAGIALLPSPGRRPALVARALVDGGIVAALLLWISWSSVGSVVASHAEGFPGLISLAYPIGDVVVVSCAAYAAGYSSRAVRPIVLTLALGWLCNAIADSAFAYQQAAGTYATGHLPDAGWVAGFALAALAGIVAARRPWPSAVPDGRPVFADVVVYATVLVGLVDCSLYVLHTPIQGFLYWNAVAVVVLLIARQVLAIIDNRHLDRDRLLALEAMRASEARLDQLTAEAPIVLFAVDARGTFTVVRGTAVPGAGEAIGHNIHNIADQPLKSLVQAALEGQESSGNISIRGRQLEIRCTPLAGGGVVGVAVDVSDRVAAEVARRESMAKDRFLANMSHELRTPLNSILGFAQMLELETTGPLNDRQRRYQQHILAGGRHLLDLITEILDLAKVGSGQMDVETRPVALGPVVASAVASIRPQLEAAELSLHVQPLGSVEVVADERRLNQVVLNLLSNAVKFTAPGGWIRVTATASGEHVDLEVGDTGIGIAPEDQERIFEEFTQLDGGRKRDVGGTGLGLALSRALTRRMGGELSVSSLPGTGSTFRVRLPASGSAQLPDELAQPAQALAKVAVSAGQADPDRARRG